MNEWDHVSPLDDLYSHVEIRIVSGLLDFYDYSYVMVFYSITDNQAIW